MTPNDFANVVCRIMNEALAASPFAISRMVRSRTWCGHKLGEHPHIIVRDNPIDSPGAPFTIGLLGLLNGILSAAGCSDRLAAMYDNQDESFENVLRFAMVVDRKEVTDVGPASEKQVEESDNTARFAVTYEMLKAMLCLPEGVEIKDVDRHDEVPDAFQVAVAGEGLKQGVFPRLETVHAWQWGGWSEA